MSRVAIFWVLIIISTLASVIYLVLGLQSKSFSAEQKRTCLLKGIVMLVCPVAGPIFFGASWLLYRLLFRQDVDLEDVVFSKEKHKATERADEERGRNMAPLEETIAVSDKESLRTLMLNVIRGDIQNSLASIALALNSQDSETSHYAAAVLQEELNTFRANVQKIYVEMEKEEDTQTEYERYLLSYMNSVLQQKVFSEMEQEKFVRILESAAESLYKKDKKQLSSKAYEEICLRLLDIKDYQTMEKWCDRAFEQYPEALSSYTCRLKLYFTSGQRDKFFEVLESLKKSHIVIDKETLELIRIFS